MKRLLTTESNTFNYIRKNNEYRKINKIGDEKLWKSYIKK